MQAIPEINQTGVEIKWNSIPNSGSDISFPIPDSMYPENNEIVNVKVDKTSRSESSADLSNLNWRPNRPMELRLKVSTNRLCVIVSTNFLPFPVSINLPSSDPYWIFWISDLDCFPHSQLT